MTRLLFHLFLSSFPLLIIIPCTGQFQHRFGARNVFVYKSKEDSLLMITVQEKTDEELRRKPVRQKVVDSLMNLSSKIYSNGLMRTVYLPERDYLNTDSIKPDTDLEQVTRLSVYRKAQIPDVVWKCKNLEALELLYTQIEHIPEQLAGLQKLKKLFVYNNRSKKALSLSENSTIAQLSIRSENPTLLPKSYHRFSALEKLDLSENHLTKFPNGARKNRKLQEMNLQRNQITLSNRIKKHKYLEIIALHENQIVKVPRSIKNFRNLKKLSLNTNGISEVDDAIGKLKRLEQLSFYKNKLTAVPKGAYHLKELGQIDLFYNEIEKLDEGFANWQKLHTLYISHNKFTQLPDNLDTLKSLTGLYAWDNRIGELPKCLSNMTGLLYLRVNRNYIKSFPAGMEKLSSLEEIDISHNYFTSLPDVIYQYPNLKILAVVNNPWNEQTWKTLHEKAAELVKRDVSVHLSEKD